MLVAGLETPKCVTKPRGLADILLQTMIRKPASRITEISGKVCEKRGMGMVFSLVLRVTPLPSLSLCDPSATPTPLPWESLLWSSSRGVAQQLGLVGQEQRNAVI